MPEFKSKWWTPETTTSESNTPKDGTDKTDKRAFVGNVSAFPKDIPSESPDPEPDLMGVIPRRDGSDLERLAYEVRDTRLIAKCRGKAVELQGWLTAHFDEHMATYPFGLPEWISTLIEFNFVERDQLRSAYRYQGCIHGDNGCPDEVPVNCGTCEGRDE